MSEKIDIRRMAHQLIEQHGEEAPIFAAQRVDAMLARGDLEGRDVWRAVLRTVDELRGTEPRAGVARH